MIYNRIPVVFGNLRKITIPPVSFQYDIVQKLIISGLELPEYYQVDFCNDGDTSTITMVGTADGVDIPDQFLQTGKTVKAYLVVTGVDDGAAETRYEITIPVNKRPTRTDIEPTPVEQSTIDSLIAAMNDAVDDAEASATAAEGFAENAEASAERAEQAAQSIDGKVERAEAAAQAAGVSATRAEDAAEDALVYKNDAAESAGSASSSAEDARDSKETAIEKAAEAEQSAAQAAASAASAESDAQEAEQAAQQAEASADAASQSATAAQGSATAASGSATVATNKAAEASVSATTATNKATEAANSATAAVNAQTGAEAAQAASEAAQQAAEEAAQEAQTILVDKAPVITDTASGAIATFPDGADGLPLKRLVAQIEPVQDLHGQDAPYPPGGGKNLFDKDAVETSKYLDTVTGLPVSASAVYCVSDYIPVKNGVSVYIPASSTARRWFYNASKEPTTYLNNPNGQAFTPTEDGYIRVSIKTDVVSLDTYQIEYGTYATSYAPYSNECPISGWTGMNGQRTGVNVCEEVWEDGYISASGGLYSYANAIRSKNFNKCKPGTSYCYKHISTMNGCTICWYDVNKNFIARVSSDSGSGTVTSPDNAYYFKLSLYNYKSQDAQTYQNDISINYPSTDTDYHAYSGESLSVSWQDTAGTVYGGTMTVNEDGSGELVAEYAQEVFNSADGWVKTSSSYPYLFQKTLANQMKRTANNVLSTRIFANIGEVYEIRAGASHANTHFISVQTNPSSAEIGSAAVIVKYTSTEMTDFNAFLTGTPFQIVYELATPLTYHFDNLTQLTTLLGTNNIWVDTGDVSVDYRADTKLYLEKLTAPTEDDMIANSAIASGTFFMIGNTLYKALTAIASGATITPGTNATQLSLADALNLLNT